MVSENRTLALILLAALTLSWTAASAGGLSGLFRSQVAADEQAKQADYLRNKLLRNRANLEQQNTQQNLNNAAPAQPAVDKGASFDAMQESAAQESAPVVDLRQMVLDRLQKKRAFGFGSGGTAGVRRNVSPAESAPLSVIVPQNMPASPPPPPPPPSLAPDDSGGRLHVDVYVPYEGSFRAPVVAASGFVLRSLLEKLREEPDAEAVDVVEPSISALEAVYDVRFEASQARASATITLVATGTGWKEFSFTLQPASLSAWKLDGRVPEASEALLERSAETVTVRLAGTGRHKLELDLASALTGTLQEGAFNFGSAPAASTRCTVAGLPKNVELTGPAPSWDADGARAAWFEAGASLSLSWRPRTVLPSGGVALTAAEEQERVTVESFTVLTFEPARVSMLCRAQFSISNTGTRLLAFRLPAGWDFLDVRNVGGTAPAEVAAQADGRTVLRLADRTRGQYTIDLFAEKVASTDDGQELALEGPAFPGVERENGFLAAVPEPGSDLSVAEERGLNGADPRELPAFARELGSPSQVALRSFQRPGYSAKLRVSRRARVEVAKLEVGSASAQTLVAGAGQSLTSITYWVQNTREQFLGVRLPADAGLEAVTVAGKPVKPASDKDPARRLIPLAPSNKTPQGLAAYAVTLVYSTPSQPLSRLGTWKGALPQVQIPVEEIAWDVYLPSGYRFARSGGEFRESGAAEGSFDGYLSQEVSGSADMNQTEPTEQKAQAAKAPAAGYKRGLYGISAPVPRTANGRSFKTRLVSPEAPTPVLELEYVHEDLQTLAQGLLFWLSLLVLPTLVLGRSMAVRLFGLLLAAAVAGLGLATAGFVDFATAACMTAGGLSVGFLVLYGLFTPLRRRRMRQAASAGAAALLLMVSMAPLDAQTPPGPETVQPPAAVSTAASTVTSLPYLVLPYGEHELLAALRSSDPRGLMPAWMSKVALDLHRPRPEVEKVEPPVGYSLVSGSLGGDISGDVGTFRLQVAIDVLQDGYQAITLLEGEFAVSSFEGDGVLTVEGAEDYLQQEISQGDAILDGLSRGRAKIRVLPARLRAKVVLQGKGRHTCTLEVVKRKPFELTLPAAVTCAATIAFDREGVDADIAGGLKSRVKSGEGKTVLTAELTPGEQFRIEGYEAAPGTGGDLIEPETEEPAGPATQPAATEPGPAREAEAAKKPHLSATVRTDLSVGESLVKGFSIIDYTVRRARAAVLELAIPVGIRINKLQGPEGRELPIPRLPAAKDGFQLLTLQTPPAFPRAMQLVIQFERPLAEGETSFPAPLPRTVNTDFENGYVTVQREGNVELGFTNQAGIEEVAPDRLPFATTPATSLAFRYSGKEARVAFTVARHTEARLSTVALDSASMRTEFNATGGLVTRVELSVRRSSGQYLKLRLPNGATLKQTLRDNLSVDLTRDADGALLFPLDTARGADSPASSIVIEYRETAPKLETAGTLEFVLPSFDVPITGSGISWHVISPDSHRIFLDRKAGGAEAWDVLGLFGRTDATTGRAFMAGPGDRTTVKVRYLSKWAAAGVSLVRTALYFAAGAALLALLHAGFPGGGGLALLLVAVCCAALGLLNSTYPPGYSGAFALAFGALMSFGLAAGQRLGIPWRRARAGAAVAALLVLGSSPAPAEGPKGPEPAFLYLRSEEASGIVTQQSDWLLLPRSQMEETLRQLEGPDPEDEPEPPAAPAEVLPGRGEVSVEIGSDDARVTAVYRFDLFTDAIREVALGNPGSIVSVTVDGKPAELAASPETGQVVTYLRGRGAHKIELTFHAPVTRVKDAGWLEWEQPRLPACQVAVRISGTGRGIEIVPSLATRIREEAGDTRATAVVRMCSNVFVRWFEKGEQVAEVPRPREEVRFEADVATGYRLEGDRLSGRTGLTYRVSKGALAGLTVLFPKGTEVLDVTGPSLRSWKQDDKGRLELHFDRFRSDTAQLWLDHASHVPAANTGTGKLGLEAPRVEGASVQSNDLSVRGEDGIELRAGDSPDLRAIDPSELPAWLQSEGIPIALRGVTATPRLDLEFERKKGLETPSFDAPTMSLEVLPGLDRWMATRLSLTIRNNTKQHLRVTLPKDSVPIDCKVQGEPRKPGQVEGGLLIPLVRSTGQPDNLDAYPLELTYLSQAGLPEGATGRWRLPLPTVEEFPIGRLQVSVAIPPGRKLVAWTPGLEDDRRELPTDRVASAVETLATLVNPLTWMMPTFRSARSSSMLQRVASAPGYAKDMRANVEGEMATGRMPSRSDYSVRRKGGKRESFERRAHRPMKEMAKKLQARSAVRDEASDLANELDMDEERDASAAPSAPAAAGAAPGQMAAEGMMDQAPPPPPSPEEAQADEKADAYEALQRSLGDRGALPVGVRNEIESLERLTLSGALYPAAGTPPILSLMVYDPSTRLLLEIGLALLGFFLSMLTFLWAVKHAWRMPFFVVLALLPLAGFVLEWSLGEGTLPWIFTGLAMGVLAALARGKRQQTS